MNFLLTIAGLFFLEIARSAINEISLTDVDLVALNNFSFLLPRIVDVDIKNGGVDLWNRPNPISLRRLLCVFLG